MKIIFMDKSVMASTIMIHLLFQSKEIIRSERSAGHLGDCGKLGLGLARWLVPGGIHMRPLQDWKRIDGTHARRFKTEDDEP